MSPAAAAASQSTPSTAAPSQKLTRGRSCTTCQARKLRCDARKPCANCLRAGCDCRVAPLRPPRRRSKKPDVAELLGKVERYERQLRQLGFDASGSAGGAGRSGKRGPVAAAAAGVQEATPESDAGSESASASGDESMGGEEAGAVPMPDRPVHYFTREARSGIGMLRGDHPNTMNPQTAMHSALDTVFDASVGMKLFSSGAYVSLTQRHPPGMASFRLWQVYLTNVDPLLKITHAPSLQKRIFDAAADLGSVPRNLEALMFNIYLAGVISLNEDEVASMLNRSKTEAIADLQSAAEQALVNVAFMRSNDLMVLQAFLLYLINIRIVMDPRTHFSFLGMAVRMAHRQGLHHNGAKFGLLPFECEQRSRLWWNLVILDKRIAETQGASVTAFSSSRIECRRPRNVNDSDLHEAAREPPVPSDATTETAFLQARLELSTIAPPDGIRPLPSSEDPITSPVLPCEANILPRSAYRPSTDVDRYVAYVENNFLRKCDLGVPMQLFTILITRLTMCKLHLLSSLKQGGPRSFSAQSPASTTSTSTSARNTTSKPKAMEDENPDADMWLFVEAIRMLEYDVAAHEEPGCAGFRWHLVLHFPMPAYMFLLHGLRVHPAGILARRAWAAMDANHAARGLLRVLSSPMHVAFGPLFLRAWDAHVAAEKENESQHAPPKVPEFISVLRRLIADPAEELPENSGVPMQGAEDTSVPGALAGSFGDFGSGVAVNDFSAFNVGMFGDLGGLEFLESIPPATLPDELFVQGAEVGFMGG